MGRRSAEKKSRTAAGFSKGMLFGVIAIFYILRLILNFDIVLDTILFLLHFALLATVIIEKPVNVVKYFYIYFSDIMMLTGLFICNNFNVNLIELGSIQSYQNGSFVVGVFYFSLILFLLNWLDEKLSQKILEKTKVQNKKINNLSFLFPLGIFAVGVALLCSVIGKQPAFLVNMDRFAYVKYIPDWVNEIIGFYTALLPLTVFPFIRNGKKVKLGDFVKIFISVLPFILFGIWTGNKFGMFLNIFVLAFVPAIIYNLLFAKGHSSAKSASEFSFKKMAVIIGGVVIVFGGILSQYYSMRGLNMFDSIMSRTAQQGQLMWASYEYKDYHMDELNDEIMPLIESATGKEVKKNFGVYKLMQRTVPSNLYEWKISTGARYASQGMDIAYYYAKTPGLIINAVFRILFEVLLVNLLIKFCLQRRFIGAIFASKLLIAAHAAFVQGDFYSFTTRFMILIAVLFVISEILRNSPKSKRKIANR